ncbi:NAD-dependent epimerase [Nesterenkonia sp. NBAIMH1]|uniref:NAD-dependent epimerase n=1 Tax=Nesterenkonia sp. NBAIMH1 TaxID=2600320 RepID=UPI0011B45322|nr:NAD-dependent epimerase [Nesterenkonia sp. NBAIMH1]
MRILVTGSAGFIGSELTLQLLKRGDEVVGIDNMNDYYDPALKRARLERHIDNPKYSHVYADIANNGDVQDVFAEYKPERVVHLAAQAGVRYSLSHPLEYIRSNVLGFAHILEGCRAFSVEHLVYASSSSVYGANESMPFSTKDNVDHPLNMYAATKKSNESMAHAYSHLYGIPTTGLRFFTVYGPWGRPDMAPYKFTSSIFSGDPINVYNYGRHRRDFTYIDDIVMGVERVLDAVPLDTQVGSVNSYGPDSSSAPWRIYNIGNQEPVELLTFIHELEENVGAEAEMIMLPLQPGDLPDTYADVEELIAATGYSPTTPISTGVKRFVAWFRDYHGLEDRRAARLDG